MAKLFRVEHLMQGASSQDCMNRYWYNHNGNEDITAEQVAEKFAESIGVAFKAMSSLEWVQTAVFVAEVLAGADAHLLQLTNGQGIQGGDAAASFNTFSFFMKPVGPTIKRGGKRIGGVAEPATDDDLAATTWGAILAAFAELLVLGLETEEGISVNPAIVRETDTSWIVSELVGASYRQVSTMRSRLLSRSGGGTALIARAPGSVATLAYGSLATVTTDAEVATFIEGLQADMLANTSPGEFTYAK